MSTVKGRIAIDVQFTDATTSAGVQSLKTISLNEVVDATATNTRIVYLTGTANTTGVTVNSLSTTYRNSAGNTVAMNFERFVFKATPAAVCIPQDQDARPEGVTDLPYMVSRDNRVVVGQAYGYVEDAGAPSSIVIRSFVPGGGPGTASWTLLLIGGVP